MDGAMGGTPDGTMGGTPEISSDDSPDVGLTAPCPSCGWERGSSPNLTLCTICSHLADIRELRSECQLTYTEKRAIAYALEGVRDLVICLVNQAGRR